MLPIYHRLYTVSYMRVTVKSALQTAMKAQTGAEV
jgi:hypothetical protein